MANALKALIAAEYFIRGFEDDDMQEGIPEMLADIRAAIAELQPAPSNRPGDQAAEYAAETGCSYERALVACNMD